MSLIFKISARNILRHKGKSLIIGIIIFLGSLLMTLGSAVVTGMEKGLHDNIVERFTGDYVIMSTNQKSEAVVAGGGIDPTESLPEYTNIDKVLKTQTYIDSYIPVCRGVTMVLNDKGDMGYTALLGVDIDRYEKMFHNNIVAVEGKLLSDGMKGCLVTKGGQSTMYNQMDVWLTPEGAPFIESNLIPDAKSNRASLNIQSNVVFMGMNSSGDQMDIRTPVIGIIKYKKLDNFWGGGGGGNGGGYSILDLESFRECFAYNNAENTVTNLTGEKKKIFGSDDNLDSLFGGGSVVKEVETGNTVYKIGSLKRTEVKTVSNANLDAGVYNLIFVKIKPGSSSDAGLVRLNTVLSNSGLGVKAVTWKKAAGTIGDLASIMKIVLYVFVGILFFVAVIIITNTLSMAALERTTEIGMMRAVGADKNFVSGMFLAETVILSGIFGGFGIISGGIIAWIFTGIKISGGTNNALEVLFGGDVLNPILNGYDIIGCIILLLLVTIIAYLYPNIVARNITPLEAIARD
ncbi:MAG: FtsX-like permease family protein [Brevinematales bacterium]|jgi:ABC-type lipoprotein release transport system permease subunit